MDIEGQLIKKIIKGDQSSFAQLVSKYQDQVFSVCLSILKNKPEAQEAAQDTFVKIYKNIEKYNFESKFSTWSYKIAYRTSLDYIRKRKSSSDIDDVAYAIADGSASDEDIESEQIKDLLSRAIDELNSEEAAVLRLFYLKELRIKEIQEITGLTNNNVKVKLFRARKRLGEIVLNKYPDLASYFEN